MRMWGIVLAVIVAAYLLLLVVAAFTEFPDIPCQDGVWDPVEKTCVPT